MTNAPTGPTCTICGQVYGAVKGDPKRKIPVGTAFEALPADWVCPSCGAAKNTFLVPE
ncbi:MAG: rubredoxin [Kiritimatiellae bacterium]|nr:rubredoxin [Kiritimatiellia bacterium]